MAKRNTFYIKLGKGGEWKADCVRNGLMRIGWTGNPLSRR